MNPRKPLSDGAFTLTELLAVIVVLALLAILLMPVFQKMRASGDSVVCATNMRNCYVGIVAYANDHGGYLPDTYNTLTAGWTYTVGPYVVPGEIPYTSKAIMRALQCPTQNKQLVALTKDRSRSPWWTIACSEFLTKHRLSAMSEPSHIIAFSCGTATAGGYDGRLSGGGSYWKTPGVNMVKAATTNGIYQGGVHNGRSNVCWMDGHIEACPDVARFTKSPYSPGGTQDVWSVR